MLSKDLALIRRRENVFEEHSDDKVEELVIVEGHGSVGAEEGKLFECSGIDCWDDDGLKKQRLKK